MKRWAACLLLLGVAWAGSAEVRPAADTQAAPGAYATMLFEVWGQGEVEPRVLAPEGWQTLPLPETLKLSGKTPVALTVRVPELTPAGSKHSLILQVWDGNRLLHQASASVEVLLEADLILFVENKLEARLGEPIAYRVTVLNRGNARDRVLLEAESNTGESFLRPTLLELEPGAEGTATLTLQIGDDRQVSPGYTMITWVRARSSNGDLERRVRVTTRWLDPSALDGAGPDPTLRFLLSGSLGMGTRIEAGRLQPVVFSYALQPSLSGRLSDFVEASARPAIFGGRSPRWWPEAPASLNLSLKGSGWDASLLASRLELGAQAGFKLGHWRYGFSMRGRYDLDGYGLSASAVSLRKELNLQLNASTHGGGGSRQDRFSIDYSHPLGRALDLRLGARVSGLSDTAGGYGYALVASARQGLLWQGERFSLLQSLSASPQLGLYAVTLTGGTRSVYPLGFRGTALLEQRPEGLGWKASGSLFATPAPRFALRLTTAAEDKAANPPTLLINPSLSFDPPNLKGVRSRFSLGYTFRYTPQTATALHMTTASAQIGFGSFGLKGRGSYTLVGPRSYDFKVSTHWRPFPLTVLRGQYSVKLGKEYSEELGFSWQQYWGSGFASELGVVRHVTDSVSDRMSFYLAQKSLGGSPFGIVLGYSLRDNDGLYRGSAALTHTFSIQVGYNFAWRFKTPEPVVNAFGGRKVGRVRGVAFIDENLNGARDPGEAPLVGLRVVMGGASAKTDARGRYSLRVRPGSHDLRLSELPATLDLYEPVRLAVVEGATYEVNLPLAPTAQLPLVLFHDANRNGVQDEGERGIAFGGVRLSGPATRTFRTNETGRALGTGLLPGRYTVEPDPALLPPRFRATTDAVEIVLKPGKDNPAVRVGAAPPPKRVHTTFAPGKLAVFANLASPIVAAGAELEVRALARGRPDQVWVELEGQTFLLQPLGDQRYVGRLRLPRNTPTGPLTLRVRAARSGEIAEAPAIVTVVRKPLYTLDPVRLRVGKERLMELRLLFKANSVQLVIGEGASLQMKSDDGYLWTAQWTPQETGRFVAKVVVDGEVLRESQITVIPLSTGSK